MVTSVQPVGAKPVDFAKVQIEGTWLDDDGTETALIIKDRATGTMSYFADEEEIEIIVRQTHGMVFANLREEGEKHYSWCAIELDGDQLSVRMPDADSFAALIEKGAVPGKVLKTEEMIENQGAPFKVSNTTIVLDDPTGKWVELLAGGKLDAPWDKESSGTLRRIREAQR